MLLLPVDDPYPPPAPFQGADMPHAGQTVRSCREERVHLCGWGEEPGGWADNSISAVEHHKLQGGTSPSGSSGWSML